VPGGGVALLRAKRRSAGSSIPIPTCRPASISCSKALESPLRQIAENAGVEARSGRQDSGSKSETFGFDAQTDDYVDMVGRASSNPAKVVRGRAAECSFRRRPDRDRRPWWLRSEGEGRGCPPCQVAAGWADGGMDF